MRIETLIANGAVEIKLIPESSLDKSIIASTCTNPTKVTCKADEYLLVTVDTRANRTTSENTQVPS